ncbi:Cutinase transcription factor 1 beta [Paramyrothecium foliicola]|nr:Cutinase transcription factor 1 beta [Paramyrothecium foliicola]
MSNAEPVRIEYEGKFAIITLDNAAKFNALTQPSYYHLASLLREADANDNVIVTLIIGEGPFFSAGADLRDSPPSMDDMVSRPYWLPKLVNNNLDVARAFYSHSKILVTALNGPVLGLSAALISHSDFIYAVSDAYLLTPFSSLGIFAEGGASVSFVERLGLGKANEALILGRKIPVDELAQVGFVNKVFPNKQDFRAQVLQYVRDTFGDHLVGSSMLGTKALLRRRLIREQDEAAPHETFGGLDRFCEGIPQNEMAKVISGVWHRDQSFERNQLRWSPREASQLPYVLRSRGNGLRLRAMLATVARYGAASRKPGHPAPIAPWTRLSVTHARGSKAHLRQQQHVLPRLKDPSDLPSRTTRPRHERLVVTRENPGGSVVQDTAVVEPDDVPPYVPFVAHFSHHGVTGDGTATPSESNTTCSPLYGDPQSIGLVAEICQPERQGKSGHFLVKSLKPPSLDRETSDFLKSRGVFDLPSLPVCKRIAQTYFRHVHPFFPVLEPASLLEPLENDKLESFSLHLLWSVFLAAANFADEDVLKAVGFSSRKLMKRAMFSRSKALYDAEYERDKIALIQSVLLMGFWYDDTEDRIGPWHWNGVAIGLCTSIGLHRQTDTSLNRGSPKPSLRKSVWQQLWWACFFRETWLSAGMGRPMRIDLAYCNTPKPSANDFDQAWSELACSTRQMYLEADAKTLGGLWRDLIDLTVIHSEILSMQHRIPCVQHSKSEVDAIQSRLEAFRHRFREIDECSTDEVVLLNLYHAELFLDISSALQTLYRPFMLIDLGFASLSSASGRCEPEWLAWTTKQARNAALRSNNILGKMISCSMIPISQALICIVLVPTLQTHLLHASSSEALARQLGRNYLSLVMVAVEELRKTYFGAEILFRLFERAREKVQARQSQSIPTPLTFGESANCDEPTATEMIVSPPTSTTPWYGVIPDDVQSGNGERKTINQLLYQRMPSVQELSAVNSQAELDAFNVNEQDALAIALGAPARQVMLRAQEIGPKTGWRDGYLSVEHGMCPTDYDESPGALARSPGRVWSDLCERLPGVVARGRVREATAALPLVEGTEEVIPDEALWAAVVALGMICSIYRFEDRNDGQDGVTANKTNTRPNCPMGDELGEELVNIPLTVALPYFQISRRLGRILPHLSFPDQSSYNLKIKDVTSTTPYLARFENTELRWPAFGERAEIAFLKGCADTSASFQHGPDAIAACQEHVMNKNVEGLLREMIRLKEILERMPNAFHSISTNPNSGENYVPAQQWVHWGKFSTPLSRRCPAASGLQFPPYLVMDAFLGRKKYNSFLGMEGVHLRAWLPSNHRAFVAAIEYHYRIPEFVAQSGDPRLMGVLDGIIEAYTGERGFMGVHRYKVFGILEVAGKTGRTETNGLSGAADMSRPWEETHRQFSEAMKERLEPYRGSVQVEPHQMRGTFEECRYVSHVLSRASVDADPARSIAKVTLDLRNTGISFMPGDRLAVMPLNSWEECAKVAAALGLEDYVDVPIEVAGSWARFETHLASVRHTTQRKLTVTDILRRGHLAPITKELALKLHGMLHASSNTVLQVLATNEWPVRGSLGDLLQNALVDTPHQIWDKAFNLDDISTWLPSLMPLEVPRTYSIASYTEDLLPDTVDLAVSRAEFEVCDTFAKGDIISRAGVSSGFLNPHPDLDEFSSDEEEEILVGVSRPVAFQLPLDPMAPVAMFAGGSGIAPFRGFWQSRLAGAGFAGGKNHLYLGVQSREKFCFEEELRELVHAGFMEVHLAFSRDSRGLAYDAYSRGLVEKHIPPRYIDSLIVEQGNTICDLVMSKKQGGMGGYLYVCGSVSVFDSVMNGIRKAIYTYRTATMDNVDVIVNKAFAERRFMLDVFMTPKPLPCNLPTIPLSQLAVHTGHRDGERMWIGVHGSVYDVTDFCPMHPGGTLIIKSNAGVDCSASFDNLAHTNNPEVSSLLTKYFIGHLAAKPDYHSNEVLSSLYDLWADYLRTTVETLVAHQFEMHEITGGTMDSSSAWNPAGSSNMWVQESLPNSYAVRSFYGYQSRLLQGGFKSLFGEKLQEIVLKLSFSIANASGPGVDARLPDVLGTIARAKTSADAITCTKEIGHVGDLVCDKNTSLRFHERGVFMYAAKSVELDIELLEDLRQEACTGMDALDAIATDFNTSGEEDPDRDADRVTALSGFLLQLLERMARRLTIFYAKLAQHSIYNPTVERNPARSRWARVLSYIRNGSFFVLTNQAEAANQDVPQPSAYYMSRTNPNQNVDFDHVMSRIHATLASAKPAMQTSRLQPATLNAVHHERGRSTGQASTSVTRANAGALKAMSQFVETNNKAIRRLSRLPVSGGMTLDDLRKAVAKMELENMETQSMSGSAKEHPYNSEVPHSRNSSLHRALSKMSQSSRSNQIGKS